MSAGYPLHQTDPNTDASRWPKWISGFGEYQIMWEEGKVKHIIVDPVTQNIIVYKP